MKFFYLFAAISCALISVVDQLWIRDYFYKNNIEDYGILGSLPSFMATLGLIIFVVGIKKLRNKKMPLLILGLVVGSLYREIESWKVLAAGNGNTFDWYDIIATIIGGLLGYLIYIKSLSEFDNI